MDKELFEELRKELLDTPDKKERAKIANKMNKMLSFQSEQIAERELIKRNDKVKKENEHFCKTLVSGLVEICNN